MEKDLLLGFTRTGCGLKVIRNKHLSMAGAKKTNFAPFGIFHALKLVFKTWAVNSNCYKNVFDLPWGPKIVHIHRHPAVETSLQSETRTQALRIYQCSRRHNYAQNSNTLCSISYKYNNNLTIENSNILIVCWLEATYQESYLVPSTHCVVACGPFALEKSEPSSTTLLVTYSLLKKHNATWGQGSQDI